MARTLLPAAGLSLPEFVARHAAPGRIALVGGGDAVNRAIRLAQRGITEDGGKSLWSHAFLFSDLRADGRQWILESDMETHRGHIRWGVQENRVDKYLDGGAFPAFAILDLGLSAGETRAVLAAALDLLATGTRYPLRELVGTLATMRLPRLRAKENPLKQGNALYCSAMVAHCHRTAGIELEPAVATKHTAPEDLWAMARPHTAHLWQAPEKTAKPAAGLLRPAVKKLVHRGKAAVRARRSKRAKD